MKVAAKLESRLSPSHARETEPHEEGGSTRKPRKGTPVKLCAGPSKVHFTLLNYVML